MATIPSGTVFFKFCDDESEPIALLKDEQGHFHPSSESGNAKQRRIKLRRKMRKGMIPVRGKFRQIEQSKQDITLLCPSQSQL